jgi:hypothetical protein
MSLVRRDRRGLIPLLRAVADGPADLLPTALDDRLIRWAVETGFAPLLVRHAGRELEAGGSPLWPLVKGADLTARVLTAQQIDATADIIDACHGRVPPPVLLKGISLCDRHYPEPHLRPMRDIDILVEDDAVSTVEAIVTELGYRRASTRPAGHYDRHHHSCPLVHPDTGVWVEIHRALCSARSGLDVQPVFGAAHVRTQLRASRFRGRAVRRLSDELQIVHTACHWADGLQAVVTTGAVGAMVAMVDLVLLLKHNPDIRWDRILAWTDRSLAGRYVYLLLAYLDTHRLVDVPPAALYHLRPRQALDAITLRLAPLMIDRYVVNGQPFGRLLSAQNFTRIWRALVLGRPLPASQAHRAAECGSMRPAQAGNNAGPGRAASAPSGARRDGVGPPLQSPRRRSDVVDHVVDGELVILDRARHVVHQLNPTARYIWERCDGQHSRLQIAAGLAEAFAVATDTAIADVDAAVQQLEAASLLDGGARPDDMEDVPAPRAPPTESSPVRS